MSMLQSTPSSTTPEVSDRKRLANRANSQKSTGPKTKEGKETVALNAFKHGLCSDSRFILLPGEDKARFDAMRPAWFDDFRPQSEVRAELVDRLVINSWKMKRCVKDQTDRITKAVNRVNHQIDEPIMVSVEQHIRYFFSTTWSQGVVGLRQSRMGVSWIISELEKLEVKARTVETWNDPNDQTFFTRLLFRDAKRLEELGIPLHHPDCPDVKSIQLIKYNTGWAEYPRCAKPQSPEEANAVAASLHAIIIDHIKQWKLHYRTLPDPDAGRGDLIEEAIESQTADIERLQRYEAQLNRSFKSDFRDLMTLIETNLDLRDVPEPGPELEAVVVMFTPEVVTEQVVVERVPEPIAIVASEPAPAPNKATEPEPNKASVAAPEVPVQNKPTDSGSSSPVLPPNNFPGGWKLKDRPKK